MKLKTAFTKKDLIAVLICLIFLLANIAAITEGGRKRAQAAVCLSNLYKWGQVFQAYTADNDGFFHRRFVGTLEGYKRTWPYVYKPYYSDKMMRFCPTAVNPAFVTGPFGTWNYEGNQFRPDLYDPDLRMPGESEYNPFTGRVEEGWYTGSYGFNRCIEDMQGGVDGTSAGYWRRVDLRNASQVPIIMDCMYLYYGPVSATASPPAYDGDWTGSSINLICINRHNGYINAVFMDFSARKVGLKEIWTLKHYPQYDTCGPWTTCGGVEPNDWPEWMRGFKDY
jgi:hypothetical protein